ncbi:MAG: hypothetical protein HOC71_03405 [Candidatus Latescibacteria bacterium]|jgi:hypothetical protein|nr:hypothetical protein [Candidatus Latescibacterota bacterium]
MSEYFKSPEELKKTFCLDEHAEYEEFTPFVRGDIGFSVKRPYPSNIPYKPPITREGKPDTVVLIRVLYNPDKLPHDKLDSQRVPLWLDIGKYSKYRYNFFGYNYDDENCPTKESLAASNRLPAPVELVSIGEYFFNHEEETFINYNGNNIAGHDILKQLFDEHCETTHGIKRQWWKAIIIIAYLSESCIKNSEKLLRFLFRKGFSKEVVPLRPYRKNELKTLDAKSLDIFGYSASKNVVMTYAVLSFAVYSLIYLLKLPPNTFVLGIFGNGLLLVCFVLITLPLLEYVGPLILLKILNIFIRIRKWSKRHSPLYDETRSRFRKR